MLTGKDSKRKEKLKGREGKRRGGEGRRGRKGIEGERRGGEERGGDGREGKWW